MLNEVIQPAGRAMTHMVILKGSHMEELIWHLIYSQEGVELQLHSCSPHFPQRLFPITTPLLRYRRTALTLLHTLIRLFYSKQT